MSLIPSIRKVNSELKVLESRITYLEGRIKEEGWVKITKNEVEIRRLKEELAEVNKEILTLESIGNEPVLLKRFIVQKAKLKQALSQFYEEELSNIKTNIKTNSYQNVKDRVNKKTILYLVMYTDKQTNHSSFLKIKATCYDELVRKIKKQLPKTSKFFIFRKEYQGATAKGSLFMNDKEDSNGFK